MKRIMLLMIILILLSSSTFALENLAANKKPIAGVSSCLNPPNTCGDLSANDIVRDEFGINDVSLPDPDVWVATDGNAPADNWITVDLNDTYTISYLVLYDQDAVGADREIESSEAIPAYRYSGDNSTWTVVNTACTNFADNDVSDICNTSVSFDARYVMLFNVSTTAGTGANGAPRIGELEVWGQSVNITTTIDFPINANHYNFNSTGRSFYNGTVGVTTNINGNCTINDTIWSVDLTGGTSHTFSNDSVISEGIYNLLINCNDSDGNLANDTVQFTIDTTEPSINWGVIDDFNWTLTLQNSSNATGFRVNVTGNHSYLYFSNLTVYRTSISQANVIYTNYSENITSPFNHTDFVNWSAESDGTFIVQSCFSTALADSPKFKTGFDYYAEGNNQVKFEHDGTNVELEVKIGRGLNKTYADDLKVSFNNDGKHLEYMFDLFKLKKDDYIILKYKSNKKIIYVGDKFNSPGAFFTGKDSNGKAFRFEDAIKEGWKVELLKQKSDYQIEIKLSKSEYNEQGYTRLDPLVSGLNVRCETRDIEKDTTAPTVTINTPGNLSYHTTRNLTINYSTTEFPTSCQLNINNVFNETKTHPNIIDFEKNFSDGKYDLIVSCEDDLGNFGNSTTTTIVVSVIPLQVNTRIDYFSDNFVFNGTNITIFPNSTHPLEICLQSESNQSVTCRNIISGDLNDTFFVSSDIDWRRYYRFSLNFSRYKNASGSMLNQSSITSDSTYFRYNEEDDVILTGQMTSNSNVTYEPSHRVDFVSPILQIIDLQHNFTIFDILNNTASTLIYNGTLYNSSRTVTLNQTLFTRTFERNVSTDTDFTFYWNYSFILPNGTRLTFNTSTYNQTVQALIINTSCDDPIINVTLYQEDNLSLLFSDLKASFESLDFEGDTYDLNQSFNLTNITNVSFCLNLENFNDRMDIIFEYESTDFTKRLYDFAEVVNTNSTRYLDLYLSDNNNLTNIFITLFDENADGLENYYIQAERFYVDRNQFYNIETVRTDVNGETLFHLLPFTTIYRFRVFNNDLEEVKVVPRTTIKSSTIIISLQLVEGTLTEYSNLIGASSLLVFDNSSDEFTWQSQTENFPESCLSVVREESDANVVLYNNCQTGTSVFDSYTILENTSNQVYLGKGFFKDENGIIVGTRMIEVNRRNSWEIFGDLGLILTLTITMTLFMIGIWSPAVAVALSSVGFILSVYIGFIQLAISTVVLFVIMSGFLVFKLRR